MTYQAMSEDRMAPPLYYCVPYGPTPEMQSEFLNSFDAEGFQEGYKWMLLRHAKPLERVGWCVDGERGRDFTTNPGMAEIWRAAGMAVREVFA